MASLHTALAHLLVLFPPETFGAHSGTARFSSQVWEKNAHAMPIESDASVLMAADFEGRNPRQRAPPGASARAHTHTGLCICTLPPLLSALRARVSMPSLH